MANAEGCYDVTLSMFKSKTRLVDTDCTKPPVDWTTEHSLIFSNAAISAQSVISEQAQKTLIAKATTQANQEEQTELQMGKYHQEVLEGHRQIMENFLIICDDHFQSDLAAISEQRAYD